MIAFAAIPQGINCAESTLTGQKQEASATTQESKSPFQKAKSRLNARIRQPVKHGSNAGISYANTGMGFRTKIPAGWKISEYGDHAMRASMTKEDDFLAFSASSSDANPRLTLDYFYDEAMKRLPSGWVLKKQERTVIDGVPAIAMEAIVKKGSREMYRQRIYVLKQGKLMVFDFLCPAADLLVHSSTIRNISGNLQLY